MASMEEMVVMAKMGSMGRMVIIYFIFLEHSYNNAIITLRQLHSDATQF